MTVMQVFTQCFVQAYHENNKQVSQVAFSLFFKNEMLQNLGQENHFEVQIGGQV